MTFKEFTLYLVSFILIASAFHTRITGGEPNTLIVLGATFGMILLIRDALHFVFTSPRRR